MRRMPLVIVLAIALGSLTPATSQAAQGEEEFQTQEGSIRLLTRFTDGEGGFPGAHRRAYLVSDELNGIIGYTVLVAPETWGGRFQVDLNTQSAVPGDADLGVYLYEDLGDIRTGNRLPVTTAEYEVRAPGGERGYIPPGTKYAIVFMSRGADVTFTYRGFTPMSVEVSESGFSPEEITVGAGGYVYWTNVGEEFHSVSATGGAFDSSPTLKKPLRPEDVFSFRFENVGDYTYFDRFGEATGVVHVVPGPGLGTPAS